MCVERLLWMERKVKAQELRILEYTVVLSLKVHKVYRGGRSLTAPSYARSPRILLASWMSLGMMVTRLAWIAHKLVSSNSPTRYASLASWRAPMAADWNLKSVLKS